MINHTFSWFTVIWLHAKASVETQPLTHTAVYVVTNTQMHAGIGSSPIVFNRMTKYGKTIDERID